MNSNKGKTAPPRSGITPSPPRESLPMLRHLARLIIAILAITTFAPKASALEIKKENITFGETDLSKTNGVMTVSIPIYDASSKDEGISYKGSERSVLRIDGVDVLEFLSFPSPGEPQKQTNKYWVTTKMLNNTKTSDVFIRCTYTSDNYVEGNDYRIGLNDSIKVWMKQGSNDLTVATYTIYLNETSLRKAAKSSVSVEVALYIDENEGNSDNWVNNSANYTYKIPFTPVTTHDFSSNAGKYAVNFTGREGDYYWVLKPQIQPAVAITKDNLTDGKVSLDFYAKSASLVSTRTLYSQSVNDRVRLYDTIDVNIKAYPWPSILNATFKDGGTIELSWYTPSPSGEYVDGDEFEIQRSTDSDFSSVKTIANVKYQKSKIL